MAIKTTIQLRRDTLQSWLSNNPVLANGEIALVDKNNGVGEKLWVIRIGDGVKHFDELPETAYALSSDVYNLGDGILSSANEYTNSVSTLLSADYASLVKDETDARSAADTTLSNALTAETDARTTADTNLSNALTAETDARTTADTNLSNALTAETDARTTADTNLSNALTAETDARTTADTAISNALTAEVSERKADVLALSAEISGKVRVENESVEYINISRVNAENYHQIIVDGTADPNTVYIVSSDNINAFGERVINIGDAVDLSDAVNLKQLNAVNDSLTAAVSSISSDLLGKIEELSGQSSGLIEQVSSDLTGLMSDISSDLTGTINSVSSDLTGRIDAVSDVVDVLSSDLYALSDEVGDLQTSLTAYDVSVSALGRVGDTFSYQISQGGVEKGVIEVPYDVFVDGGRVEKVGDKTWLFLTLNNEASTVLSIEATDLVDIYTPSNKTVAEGGTVNLSIENFEVAAEVLDGSITAAKLSADSVTTAKIVDSNVTTPKIADGAITPDKMTELSVFVFDCGGASE